MSSLGVNKRVAVKVIEAFQGLPHRMTEIPGFRGIRFINDSGEQIQERRRRRAQCLRKWSLFLLAGGE